MSPRATITGAGGFIGGHIAVGLAAAGWRVTAIDRAFDAVARARLRDADLVEADLSEGVPDLPRADLLVHAAAVTTYDQGAGMSAAAHLAANTAPLLSALVHAAATGAGAFVFLSSTGVFGPGDGAPDLTDDCIPTAPHPYAAAKRAGEQLVPAGLSGICPAHVVRLGHLFGPEEASRPTRSKVSLIRRWCDAAMRGEVLELPANDPRRDWTWAPDLAPALLRLVGAAPANRPLHLVSGHVLSDVQLARLIVRACPGTGVSIGPEIETKPPAVPSRIPALDGFRWTSPEEGLAVLLAERPPE